MKTERRHELQTNQLADWLGHQVEQVRPHMNVILGISVLGAALIIGYFVYAKDRQSTLQIAWGDYYLALASRDRDALDIVAKNHAGTIVELCAKQAQADIDLATGIAALYTNRDDAYRALNDAKKSYSDVVEASGATPELTQHSLFGLGQVNEATSNLDKAKEYYAKVATQFPGSPMATEADARMKDLENPQVEKWYNWFGRQKPKPPDPASDLSSKLGFPGDLSKLSEKRDLPVSPVIPQTTTPESPDSKSADKTPETSPPGTSPPGTSPPGTSPPGTTTEPAKPSEPGKTSEPEKKADAPPAETPPATTPKTEAPKTEAPKSEAPKTEAPKTEVPKSETPESEQPKSEATVPSATDKAKDGESPKPQENTEDKKSDSPPAAGKDAGTPPGA